MPRSLAVLALIICLSLSTAASALTIGEIEQNSALNQPFNADVLLTASQEEELGTLTVNLASPDAFSSYGIDRPQFLTDIRFNVKRTGPTTAVLEMRSNQPVSEPFVTLLVKFTWSAGNLLREYTVLLDPPVFDTTVSGEPVQQAQMSAPVSADYPDPAPVAEPVPVAQATPAAPAPRPAPVVRQPEFTGESYGPIGTGQSLWGIASRVSQGTDASVNVMMIALYRANPQAFMGNINRMKAGSIMRMPSADEMAAINRADANAEVVAQNEAWRNGTPVRSTSSSQPAQLKLVAPTAESDASSDGVAMPGDGSGAADGDAAALRAELAEAERLLSLRDAEMQAMQQRIAELEAAGMAAAEPSDADAGEMATDEAVMAETDVADATDPESAAAAESADAAMAEATAEPAAEAAPEPAPEAAVTTVSTSADEGSLLDTVFGVLGNIWLWIGLAVIAVVGVVFFRRKSNPPAIGSILDEDDDELPEPPEDRGAPVAQPLPDDFEPSELTQSMVVEESVAEELLKDSAEEASAAGVDLGTQDDFEVSPPDDFDIGLDTIGPDGQDALLAELDDEVALEKTTELTKTEDPDHTATVGSETSINLDHEDPIAEADFHMAYGLYDQAAELLIKGLEDDPEDKLLRIKLLEVYFVWENKEGFAAEAQKLREQIGDGSDAEWNKVVIMGKQICPDDPLFEGESEGAGGVEILDIQLESEGAEPALDVDFGDDSEADSGLDFDIGGDSEPAEDNVIDFDLGDSESPTMETPTIEAPGSESPTMETPTLEAPGSEAPTMETPTLEMPAAADSEDTESLNLDDLDVDMSGLDDLLDDDAEITQNSIDADSDIVEDSDDDAEITQNSIDAEADATEQAEVLADDDATVLASEIDFDSYTADDAAADEEPALGEDDATMLADSTALTEMLESDAGIEETLEQPQIEGDGDTVEQPGFGDADADSLSFSEDVFSTGDGEPADYAETQAIDVSDSEVDTKLDLARAYIEMSDPDGARSILNEVLEEGSDSEKGEAERLLAELS